MMDLHDRLAALAGPDTDPTEDVVAADVARGRQALQRRRIVQSVGGSAFVAAGLAAVLTLSLSGGGATAPPPATSERAVTQLVAYTGEQPKGFTIDKVPDGWFIQADDTGVLNIAPDAAKNPGPDVDPSTSPLYDPNGFVGKIAIMLQSKDQSVPPPPYIKIGDKEGLVVRSDGDSATTVWVMQADGRNLLVQVWDGLGFTRQQMIELAAGVHVHKDAVQGVG